MKIIKAKSKRSCIFSIITVALITVLFGLNLLLSVFGLRNTVYVDLTPEGLYSVTDLMVEECSFLNDLNPEKKVKIIFCNDPDNLVDDTVTRTTYFMALKLQKMFKNLKVEAENVNYNPTKVAQYKTTSLSVIKTTDIIIAYGDRYRIVSAEAFWATGGGSEYAYYNGEYKLATFLKSVTRANDGDPVAYFVTGHGETCYNAKELESPATLETEQFKNLLVDRGLRVDVLNLSSVDAVPDDCAVLIINNPTLDYLPNEERLDQFFYKSDLEKIDRYLTEDQGSLMVAKDPLIKLESLETYLKEWGFEFSTAVLSVPRDESQPDSAANRSDAMNGVYVDDPDSYAYAIYGDFSSLSSAPKTVFYGTGYISCAYGADSSVTEAGSFDVSKVYNSFILSPGNASAYTSEGVLAGEAKSYDIASVSVRTCFNNTTAERTYSYVFCANDADFFSNGTLGNASYANFDIMSALVTNISRRDIYASMDLGGSTLNSKNPGGKQLVSTALSEQDTETESLSDGIILVNRGIGKTEKVLISLAIAVIPMTVLVLAVIVHVKRKYK